MNTTLNVDEALESLDATRVCLEMLREASMFTVTDAAEATAAQERVIILSRALERELQTATRVLRSCQEQTH